MVHNFVFILGLLLAASIYSISSKLSSQVVIALENQQPLTNKTVFDILKANRNSNAYLSNLKSAENVKVTQEYNSKEIFNTNTERDVSLAHEDQTKLRINSNTNEIVNLPKVLVNKKATEEQNVSSKMQSAVTTYLQGKEDIAAKRAGHITKMVKKHAKVPSNHKTKVTADTGFKRHDFKKVFPGDSFRNKSGSRRKRQNPDFRNRKKRSSQQKDRLLKRKVRDAKKYPDILEPILRKYFPEDFTTEEYHYLEDRDFPSDLSMFDEENHAWTKRRKGKKTDIHNSESVYFRAADGAKKAVTSSVKYDHTKILTIIVPVDVLGSTVFPVTLMKNIQNAIQSRNRLAGTAIATTNTPEMTTQPTTNTPGMTTQPTGAGQSNAEQSGTTQIDTTQTGGGTQETGGGTEQTGGGTEQTGSEQGSLITSAPPLYIPKEDSSSFKPEVNYHYHYHYFGLKKVGRK